MNYDGDIYITKQQQKQGLLLILYSSTLSSIYLSLRKSTSHRETSDSPRMRVHIDKFVR